ncbi:MAG TPA: FAD-linked oxidase C-terminal domain-containing protein, partial [Acidimicrobiales bacterium]|nr:FAD-linked oxidase C-terminal domain-containing protein [Acidimicrobiales bacterium]
VYEQDATVRSHLLHAIYAMGVELGGAISGEHGIGRTKRPYFDSLENPVKLRIMRDVKRVFDPAGILNPGVLLDPP